MVSNNILIKQVLFLLLLGAVQAQNTTIAVFDLENNGLKDSEVRILSDRLQSELVKVGGYTVVERKKIEKVFEEQKFQMSGCVEECLIEVGKLLGATEIVIGSVGKFGSTFTISARLVNATSGEMIRSSDFDSEGDLKDLLKIGMFRVASELTGKVIPAQLSGETYKSTKTESSLKGALYIESNPSSAEVYIDGYKVDGLTPITLSDLNMGNYSLQLIKDNYESSKMVRLKDEGIKKVKMSLKLSEANLNVFTDPVDALFTVDNYGSFIKMRTPCTIKKLSVGSHTIRIEKKGYELFTQKINIEKMKKNELNIKLRKLSSIVFKGDIYNSLIYIDEGSNEYKRVKGKNGLKVNVLPGSHNIKIIKPGFEPFKKVVITDSGTTEIMVKLTEITGDISFSNYPANAEFILKKFNGSSWDQYKYSKETTLFGFKWTLPIGEYSLKIKCPDYLSYNDNFEISGNENLNFSEGLKSAKDVTKKIKLLKVGRNLSLIFGAGLVYIGNNTKKSADDLYDDYQKAQSDAGKIRQEIITKDDQSKLLLGIGASSFLLPTFLQLKINSLKELMN